MDFLESSSTYITFSIINYIEITVAISSTDLIILVIIYITYLYKLMFYDPTLKFSWFNLNI